MVVVDGCFSSAPPTGPVMVLIWELVAGAASDLVEAVVLHAGIRMQVVKRSEIESCMLGFCKCSGPVLPPKRSEVVSLPGEFDQRVKNGPSLHPAPGCRVSGFLGSET